MLRILLKFAVAEMEIMLLKSKECCWNGTNVAEIEIMLLKWMSCCRKTVGLGLQHLRVSVRIKWSTVMYQTGRLERLKVDGLRRWTVLNWTVSRNVNGKAEEIKLDGLKGLYRLL